MRSAASEMRCVLLALLLIVASLPAAATDWQDGGGAKWAALLAAARQEGRVVVMGRPDLAKPFADGFQRDTGITLEFLGGEGREQVSRLARELRAGAVTIDLLFGGATTLAMAHQGELVDLQPQLLLPGVTDGGNWTDGHLKWVDSTQRYMVLGSEYIHGWPVFDGDLVKPGMITSWQDLLKPEFKGKIAAFDPRSGGPGQAAASYLADRFGIDYIKRLYIGQEVTLAAHSRQIVEWVARGTHLVALGALPTDIEQFRRNGVSNLVIGQMSDGPGALLGGSAVLCEPKGAPHPAAATVFLDWYLSKPGQQIFAHVWQVPSRRTDVQDPSIPPYVIPKPGVAYLDEYEENWYENVRPKVAEAITEALGGH